MHIGVIGGSVTAGHMAGKRKGNMPWPLVLRDSLKQRWPNITLENYARPSWSADNWLHSDLEEQLKGCDLVITEFAVNDAGLLDPADMPPSKIDKIAMHVDKTDRVLWARLLSLDRNPAVITVELFRMAMTLSDAKSHCADPAKWDGSGKYAPPQALHSCARWWMPQAFRSTSAREFQIPVVSYRDAVWPDVNRIPHNASYYWPGGCHPAQTAHTLIARMVEFSLLVADRYTSRHLDEREKKPTVFGTFFHDVWCYVLLCTDPVSKKSTTAKYIAAQDAAIARESTKPGFRFCAHPETKMDPQHPESFLATGTGCAWSFYSDVPGKPGWIIDMNTTSTGHMSCSALSRTEPAARTIWFTVKLGKKRIVQISFLASYTEVMGTAVVRVVQPPDLSASGAVLRPEPPLAVLLHSKHEARVSIPKEEVIEIPHTGTANQPNVVTISITLVEGSKFKVIGIMSC
jgi:hypothetical protein